MLLCGPPGLGKTTLAQILAHEMGVELHTTNGPVIEHKGALAGLLTKLEPNDILFIDEIHRLSPVVEETLYPAMEDFRIDVMTGEGAFASSIQIPLQPFTLVGATTRTGLLTPPLFSRFGHVVRLDFYPAEDLARIVARSARLLGVDYRRRRGARGHREALARDAAHREPPPPAGARLRPGARLRGRRRARRLEPRRASRSTTPASTTWIGASCRVIIEDYDGGPVGVETLAAALGEPRDTIEDVYEPFLLQQGYIGRTPRGRVATRKAYEHLGR